MEKRFSKCRFTKDDDYHIMPIVGDYFYCEAEAPIIKEGYERTRLKTNGYYKLHLKKISPMQTQVDCNWIRSR